MSMRCNIGQQLIGILRTGESGDVVLCRGKNGKIRLVWMIRDRETARYLVSRQGNVPWEEYCFRGEELYVYFPYNGGKPFRKSHFTEQERESFCMGLLALGMSGRLPWALLLLVLESEAAEFSGDGRLCVRYELDLDEMYLEAEEADCVQACGRWILSMLRQEEGEGSRWNLRGIFGEKCRVRRWRKRRAQLIGKKLERGRYETFLELYQDFHRREPVYKRWKPCLPENDRVLYVLLLLGLFLVLLAAGAGILFLLTGDGLLVRFFTGPLEKIGTVWMNP